MNQNKPQKAKVCVVEFASCKFEGLQLPNGEYAIAISQVAEIFQRNNGSSPFLKKNIQRDIKAILGKDYPFLKIASELNSKKVNVISLEDFGILVMKFAFKGNKMAQAIAEASVHTSIEMAFDIAFNNKQALETYEKRVHARTRGKIIRRQLTDAIDDWIKKHPNILSENGKKWIYPNCSDTTNRIVFGRSSKKLKEAWNVKNPRESMSIDELYLVESVERLAIALIDDYDYEPLSAVKEAGNRLLIKAIER